MSKGKLIRSLVYAMALTAPLAAPARADELGEKGREVFKQNQGAVVTVQVDIKQSFSRPGRATQHNETRQEPTGTVVDPSGLTVLALSACDPTGVYEVLTSGAGEATPRARMEAELTSLKILLADGHELPAEMVLRDKDLDLAFIRPRAKPAQPMAAVDLSRSATAQVLDQVITLNRLGKAADHAPAASVERVSAVVQGPRRFYVPDNAITTTALGSPAFALNGQIVGIFVRRAVSGVSAASLGSVPTENVTTIILPAGDVLQAAKQALEARGGDDKQAAPKETNASAAGREAK